MKKAINAGLRILCSPSLVPYAIYEVEEIPYAISGKKMEAPVRKILTGTDLYKATSRDTMRNPEALYFFFGFGRKE